MREFEDFLAQESAEGELVSSGEFTLELKHAMKKLAEMALKAEAEWILKVVQAAVILNTGQLDFRIGRRGVQVDLSGPPVDLQPLKDGLLNPGVQPEPFWAELFVGLRTLLPTSRFLVVSGDGEWVEWNEGDLRPGQEPKVLSPDTALTIVMVPKKPLSRRETLKYITLLETRALYAPLRLRVDGREIRAREVHAPQLPEFGVGLPRWTAPLLYVHSQKPLSELSLGDLTKASGGPLIDPLRSLVPFLSYGLDLAKVPESRHLYLKAEYEDVVHGKTRRRRVLKPSPFTLCTTRLGVVCASTERSSLIGGVLQVPRDGARTDLGGLSIEADSDDTAVRSEVTPLLTILSQAVLQHKPSLHYYGSDGARVKAAFAMSGGAGAVFGLVLAASPVLVLTLGGVAGCMGASTMLTWGRDDYATHLKPIADAVVELDSKMS